MSVIMIKSIDIINEPYKCTWVSIGPGMGQRIAFEISYLGEKRGAPPGPVCNALQL